MVQGNERKSTIQIIVGQGLCIGCGICAALCPKTALTIVECEETGMYLPRLDSSKCIHCGICLRICPGNEPDFRKLSSMIFSQKPKCPTVGNYISCYSGYAVNRNTRFKSTSGGLISALAAFALEDGIADGVLVTRANSQNPLRPRSFIARSKEDVMSAMGSKYCPVSLDSALDEILETDGRYIIVGLPCHIQGIRKAQILNKKLKNRISLVFGLVCNHTPTFHATDFLLKKFNISDDRITKLDYRTNGWPGYMKIVIDDCAEHFIPFSSLYYWGYVFQKFFWPKRCMVCNDKLCQLADIIFMDAWLPEFSSDRTGSSLIIVRSKKGELFVSKAIEREIVKLQPISVENVLRSQQIFKINRRVAVTRFAMKYHPNEYCSSIAQSSSPNPSISNILDAFHLIYINTFCKSSSKLSQLIIECHAKLWDFACSAKRKLTKK